MNYRCCAIKQAQFAQAIQFLDLDMGRNVATESRRNMQLAFTTAEVDEYVKQFQSIDTSRKGYITVNDLRPWLKVMFFIFHRRSFGDYVSVNVFFRAHSAKVRT